MLGFKLCALSISVKVGFKFDDLASNLILYLFYTLNISNSSSKVGNL